MEDLIPAGKAREYLNSRKSDGLAEDIEYIKKRLAYAITHNEDNFKVYPCNLKMKFTGLKKYLEDLGYIVEIVNSSKKDTFLHIKF